MYPNVRGEMARKNVTLAVLVNDPRIDCTISTLSLKLNGKAPLLFKEALAIQDVLKSDLPLRELFKEVDEEAS